MLNILNIHQVPKNCVSLWYNRTVGVQDGRYNKRGAIIPL